MDVQKLADVGALDQVVIDGLLSNIILVLMLHYWMKQEIQKPYHQEIIIMEDMWLI